MSSASHLGYLSDRKGKRTNPFPTRILIAAVAFLTFASGSVLFGQLTGIGVQKHPTGAPVAIRDIIILRGEGDAKVGTPTVAGASVTAQIVSHDLGTKRDIYKYRARKRYRKSGGFRPHETTLAITSIDA